MGLKKGIIVSAFAILLILLLSPFSFAIDKAILLTSLPEKQETKVPERFFRWVFESKGFEVQIQRGANLYDLRSALISPDTRVVFWVSHANGGIQNLMGLSIPPLIADRNGFDVSHALKDIAPHVQFVGIVGCQSQNAINAVLARQNKNSQHSNLKIVGSKSTLSLKFGFLKFIYKCIRHLSRISARENTRKVIPIFIEKLETQVDSEEVSLLVRRKIPASLRNSNGIFLPALTVEWNNQIIGAFPLLNNSEENQEIKISLPIATLDPQSLRPLAIAFNAGTLISVSHKPPSLGEFEFEFESANISGSWTPRRRSDGQISGTSMNIYEFHPAL